MAEDRTGVVARLDALEAAYKGATGGEWQVDDDADELAVTAGSARGLPGSFRATDRIYSQDVGEWSGETEADSEQRRADAAAIVAEHNAFPELLAVARGVLALADELDAEGAPAVENLDDWVRGRAHGITAAADWIRATVAAALGEA